MKQVCLTLLSSPLRSLETNREVKKGTIFSNIFPPNVKAKDPFYEENSFYPKKIVYHTFNAKMVNHCFFNRRQKKMPSRLNCPNAPNVHFPIVQNVIAVAKLKMITHSIDYFKL